MAAELEVIKAAIIIEVQLEAQSVKATQVCTNILIDSAFILISQTPVLLLLKRMRDDGCGCQCSFQRTHCMYE